MKKIISVLKKLWQLIIKYFYMNRLFITYVILAIIGSTILREVTITNGFSLKPFITDLGVIFLLGAIGYLFKPQNQFKYFFTVLIVFTVVEVINSVYFTFYEGFVSVALIQTLSQVETVADSIFVKLRIIDFIHLTEKME